MDWPEVGRVTTIQGVAITHRVARVTTKLGVGQDVAATAIAARTCEALRLARGGSGVDRVEVVGRQGEVMETCRP
jgi:hypothetical protein